MRPQRILFAMSALLTVTVMNTNATFAASMGTAFTYQGQLKDAGLPASAAYDFQFRLYDAATNGTKLGSDVLVGDLSVSNGLFTAQLDFGNQFNGSATWLEIAVRPGASAGSYTILTPRQPLTATPNAIYATNGGGWVQSGGAITNANTNNFVGINRSTRLTSSEYFGIQCPAVSSYGGMYIQTAAPSAKPFYGYAVSGVGSMWTEFDSTNGNWNVYNGGVALTVNNSGSVGIGTTNPTATLDVESTGYNAIEGNNANGNGTGVLGTGSIGVWGDTTDPNGYGVYGHANGQNAYGVYAHNDTSIGSAIYANGGHGTGLYADTLSAVAVEGHATTGFAIYGSNGGSNSSGYAGFFNGRVDVAGNLSKSGGSFKIDHPLDPANKYLYHSFVESPDMMNIYNGIATLDANGRATVTLPDWFEALNRDFRYQLTCIGGYAPVYISQKVKNNQFTIAGGTAGLEVSWQVTGVRHDKWAESNRIPVEEVKPNAEKNRYIHPELYGLDASHALNNTEHQFVQPRTLQKANAGK